MARPYQPKLLTLPTEHLLPVAGLDGYTVAVARVDPTRATLWAEVAFRNGSNILLETFDLGSREAREGFYAAALTFEPALKPHRATVLRALNDTASWIRNRPPDPEPDPAAAAAVPTRRRPTIITAPDLMVKQFPPLLPVVDRVVLEGVTLFAGRPKLGKSWLALGLGLAVSADGRALGQLAVSGGDVLYLALEDGERRVQRRLGKMLAGSPSPVRFHLATWWARLDEGGVDDFRLWLLQARQPRLIVVDTMARLKPQGRGNRSAYEEDYSALSPLTDLVMEFPGVALLLVTHTKKGEADDPLELISGSFGLAGSVDGGVVLKRDRHAYDAALHVIHRDADDDLVFALKRDPVVNGWVIAGDAEELQLSAERRAILSALRAVGKPMSPRAIAEATWEGDTDEPDKQHYDGTRALLAKMQDDGQVSKTGRGLYSAQEERSQRSQRSQPLAVFPDHGAGGTQRSQPPDQIVNDVNDVNALPGGGSRRLVPRSDVEALMAAADTGAVELRRQLADGRVARVDVPLPLPDGSTVAPQWLGQLVKRTLDDWDELRAVPSDPDWERVARRLGALWIAVEQAASGQWKPELDEDEDPEYRDTEPV